MIGDTRAVKALISALKDSDRYVRQVAIGALIKTGEPAVKQLISALRDNYVRDDVVIDALVKIGKPAVEPLITALKDVSKVVREVAAEALGNIGDPYGMEPLIATLKDKHKYVRQAAAEALDRLGWFPGEDENGASYWVAKKHWDKCIEISTLAVEPLIIVLSSDDQDVRGVAAEALGKIGDARAVEPLIAVLHNSDDKNGRSMAARRWSRSASRRGTANRRARERQLCGARTAAQHWQNRRYQRCGADN
jgi:HEAT repeat protein